MGNIYMYKGAKQMTLRCKLCAMYTPSPPEGYTSCSTAVYTAEYR